MADCLDRVSSSCVIFSKSYSLIIFAQFATASVTARKCKHELIMYNNVAHLSSVTWRAGVLCLCVAKNKNITSTNMYVDICCDGEPN